jgi:hypothetical protein
MADTAVEKGWIHEGDQTYFVDEDGQRATGLMEIDGITYYFNDEGVMQTGFQDVDGSLYYFEKDGKAAKKGFCGGGKYYSSGDGELVTGWKAIGSSAYYFSSKNGERAYNKKVKYLKIGKSGKLGKAYAQAIRTLDRQGWSLRAAYNYSSRIKYKNRWMRRKTSEQYATYGFTHHYGNCYVMAATFYTMAKILGYDCHQIQGRVGVLPHSWTEIRQNGRTYVYDPNFKNETGRNGFRIWYGKRGTWRYAGKKRMN